MLNMRDDEAMFREITISKPAESGPKRRWYQSDYFDLYVFYIRHSVRADKHADREFVGLQLCYDIRRNQRTLEWKKEGGFSHHAVKKGGDTLSDHGASAALLQKGGTFDAAKVIDRFMADSGSLPGQIKTFVLKQLTMMGGPIDSRRNPTQVNNLATTKPISWFEHNVIHRVPANQPGFMRRVYPGFLQHAGFVAMNPDRHMQSHQDYYNHLVQGDGSSAEAHRQFYDEYNAVLDMDADYYLDTIRLVFQEHALANGTWVTGKTLGNQKVEPAAITKTALFTIEGELDDISGGGQTQAAHDLCTGVPKAKKLHFTAPQCGHYGIFAGRRWRDLIQPKIADFIRKNA